MKHIKIYGLLVIIALLAVGCQSMPAPKPFSELVPKEKVSLAMAAYNNATAEYRYQFDLAVKPFSKESAAYFQAFKKTLGVAWTAIGTYDVFVAGNMTPTPDAERAIIDAIRQLQALVLTQIKIN